MELDELMYNRMGASWYEQLEEYILSDNYQKVREYLDKRSEDTIIYPDAEQAFAAFKASPYESTKVVILGQDPYHDGSANGLAFSTYVKLTPSLRVILNSMSEELGLKYYRSTNLIDIAEQGVLLLNTAMSVERKKAGSHLHIWKEFIDTVLSRLYDKTYLVWMLWGNSAKEAVSPPQHHSVLSTNHPAAKIYNPDVEFKPQFLKCNELLRSHGLSEINWFYNEDDLPF